jgi:hypothetical protein
MTREDIIRMAREAGMTGLEGCDLVENFERFANLVAAAEREACAALCDRVAEEDRHVDEQAELCAFAIRERGAP